MSEEKGSKTGSGVDKPQETHSNENESTDVSLLDRVGRSASGLLQSFSGRSAPTTISSDLASLHASASKGESSSSSRDGGTVDPQQTSAVIQAQDSESKTLGYAESFRTKPAQDSSRAQAEFDHWSRSSVNLPDNDLIDNDKNEDPIGHVQGRKGKTPVDTMSRSTGGRQYGNIVESDGAALASLLSQPNFDVDVVPSDTWKSTSQIPEPDIESDCIINRSNPGNSSMPSSALSKQNHHSVQSKANNLDAEAIPIAHAKASKAIPGFQDNSLGSNGHQNVNKDHGTNQYGLIPNFWNSAHDNTKNNMDDNQRNEIQRDISMADEQTQPWLAIINKYQDEVWGDLLPLVYDAREEITKAKKDKDQPPKNSPVGPAVRRLQMVLKHINISQD